MTMLVTIALSTVRELTRRPEFFLVLIGGSGFILLLGNVSYFAMGEEARMVKQSALAFLWLAGLLNAALCASATLSRELRAGTVLMVLSKPVGRSTFFVGKYVGVSVVMGLQCYVHLLATLVAGGMVRDVGEDLDWVRLGWASGVVFSILVIAACSHYFFQRSFVSDASWGVILGATLGAVIMWWEARSGGAGLRAGAMDGSLVSAGCLIVQALLVMGGFALAVSTRMDVVATLAACTGLFLLGLVSDYVFGRAAAGGSWLAGIVHGILPNWQVYWLPEGMPGPSGSLWGYVTKAWGYTVAQVALMVSVGLALFEQRDLG